MIFQIIGIEYNTFHFKTVWSNFGDDWRVLMRQLKLYYWKGWLVSIDSLCSLSCCSPIHEPVAIPLRTGTEYTSRWSLFSVWNGTLTKDVTPATPCRTYKSFLTKLTLKWHRKYLVQINLCQKLSFLQNIKQRFVHITSNVSIILKSKRIYEIICFKMWDIYSKWILNMWAPLQKFARQRLF